jgi:hypothetical protein
VIPLVVSFGGGVNSAAMLVGMHDRGIIPDYILFADTGGEKPETYEFISSINKWCSSVLFPAIVTVRNDGRYESLEAEMIERKTLPPIVMGWKTCSDKYKQRPISKWLKKEGVCSFTKAIGFDAGEPSRAGNFDTDVVKNRYFLVEWGWFRKDCLEALRRHGFNCPPKSSCFFCPSMKKWEILALEKDHPELFARAVGMERNAQGLRVAGLGRHWSWSSLVNADKSQLKMFADPPTLPCMCNDGDPDDDLEPA